MISNRGALAAAGMAELRAIALRVATAGLEACDVRAATGRLVSATDAGIEIAGVEYPLAEDSRVVVLGSGKATLAIAAALEDVLGELITHGAVVVRDGEDTLALERIEVHVADHPLPTARSVAAAERVLELGSGLGPEDLVIASFTGGSSALTSLPPDGVSEADKRLLHELMLGSGAPIIEVNAVRKHVSAIKGGRLAARIAPARLVNLTVSDVAGDVLDAITDPTVQDTSSAADAIAILKRRGLWDEVPASVRGHFESPAAESPTLAAEPHTVMLVDGAAACEAMASEARAAGVAPHIVSTTLEGEASAIGAQLAELAQECLVNGTPAAPPCVLVGCGGEATVTLQTNGSRGMFGDGGPNQEAALAAALALESGAPVSACFLDTDGADGGTAVAGAIIDGHTAARAQEAGIDLRAAIGEHRSAAALAKLGDQVVTGPTQTNVNDLFVFAVGVPEAGR